MNNEKWLAEFVLPNRLAQHEWHVSEVIVMDAHGIRYPCTIGKVLPDSWLKFPVVDHYALLCATGNCE